MAKTPVEEKQDHEVLKDGKRLDGRSLEEFRSVCKDLGSLFFD